MNDACRWGGGWRAAIVLLLPPPPMHAFISCRRPTSASRRHPPCRCFRSRSRCGPTFSSLTWTCPPYYRPSKKPGTQFVGQVLMSSAIVPPQSKNCCQRNRAVMRCYSKIIEEPADLSGRDSSEVKIVKSIWCHCHLIDL